MCDELSALKTVVHTSCMETRPPKRRGVRGGCLVAESREENSGVTHLCIDHQRGWGSSSKPIFSLKKETLCFWHSFFCCILHFCTSGAKRGSFPFSIGLQLELKDAACPVKYLQLLPALPAPALRAIEIPPLSFSPLPTIRPGWGVATGPPALS